MKYMQYNLKKYVYKYEKRIMQVSFRINDFTYNSSKKGNRKE